MGLQWVLDFFRRNAPEAVRHLDAPTPTLPDYYALEQERLDLELRCELFERLLIQKGETRRTLAAQVALYKRGLQVGARERRA